MAKLEKCFEEVSFLDLLIIGRKLGVDVDSIDEKHLAMERLELEKAIIEVNMKGRIDDRSKNQPNLP